MTNFKKTMIERFREKFVRGHGPIANAHFDVQEAESWIEADPEMMEDFLYDMLDSFVEEKVKALRNLSNYESVNTRTGRVQLLDKKEVIELLKGKV